MPSPQGWFQRPMRAPESPSVTAPSAWWVMTAGSGSAARLGVGAVSGTDQVGVGPGLGGLGTGRSLEGQPHRSVRTTRSPARHDDHCTNLVMAFLQDAGG